MTDSNERVGVEAELNRQSRELKTIRELLSKVINYMVEAESEVSEKMRRFIMYMHDLHDVCFMYESRGQPTAGLSKRSAGRWRKTRTTGGTIRGF